MVVVESVIWLNSSRFSPQILLAGCFDLPRRLYVSTRRSGVNGSSKGWENVTEVEVKKGVVNGKSTGLGDFSEFEAGIASFLWT